MLVEFLVRIDEVCGSRDRDNCKWALSVRAENQQDAEDKAAEVFYAATGRRLWERCEYCGPVFSLSTESVESILTDYVGKSVAWLVE